MLAVGVTNASLALSVFETAPGSGLFRWRLIHVVAGYSEVIQDYPSCSVESGDRFFFFGGSVQALSDPFPSINCVDPFQINTNWVFGVPPHPVTIEFFDLSGAPP